MFRKTLYTFNFQISQFIMHEGFYSLTFSKNTSIEHKFCWILFCCSVSISFITWPNIAQSLNFWQFSTVGGKRCWKMSKIKILCALWAKKSNNENCKEFCETPCDTLTTASVWPFNWGRQSSYNVARLRLHLAASIDFWRDSTLCLVAEPFCMTKNVNFRRQPQ